MIQVILFDLGEVVLTNDWHYECPEKFVAYSEYFGIIYDEMEEGWKSAWPDYELGKISEDVFWERFLTAAHAKKIDVEKAKVLWKEYFGSKEGMIDLLKKLKQKRYTLAVASSTGKEWLAYKRKTYHLDEYFSDYFTTCDMRIKKTDKIFFEEILRQLQIPSQNVLLVDDTQKILDVASTVGIQTIRFQNAQQLTEDFKMQDINL